MICIVLNILVLDYIQFSLYIWRVVSDSLITKILVIVQMNTFQKMSM